MKYKFFMLVLFIGWAIAALSTVSGIGYGLYNWGSVGLELGASAWLGFVLFLKMLIGGLFLVAIGVMGAS